eukprot:scaffold63711_cov32-Tisochrysis_lutea.AAC.2
MNPFEMFFSFFGLGGGDEEYGYEDATSREFVVSYGGDQLYGANEGSAPSPPPFSNYTCLFPLNKTLTVINGTLYIEDAPSCGDVPALILFALVMLILILTVAQSSGGPSAAARSLGLTTPPAPPPSKSYMKQARAKASGSQGAPMV